MFLSVSPPHGHVIGASGDVVNLDGCVKPPIKRRHSRCRPTNGLTEVRHDPSLLQALYYCINTHKDHPLQEGAGELSTFHAAFGLFMQSARGWMLMRVLGRLR